MAAFNPPSLAPEINDSMETLLQKIAAILYAVTYGNQTLTLTRTA